MLPNRRETVSKALKKSRNSFFEVSASGWLVAYNMGLIELPDTASEYIKEESIVNFSSYIQGITYIYDNTCILVS